MFLYHCICRAVMTDKQQYKLLDNVHEFLAPIHGASRCALAKGSYKYYHYKCDGFNDVGWGCGYRTLQTICSWIINAKQKQYSPPDITEVQKILVDIGDKSLEFHESQDWIGAVEIFMVLNTLYDVDCRLVHVSHGSELSNYTQQLYDHFESFGSPIMMGGEKDNSSKGIMGIACCENDEYLLVVDPHFIGTALSPTILITSKWVRWEPISEFCMTGYYNLVLPMCHIIKESK